MLNAIQKILFRRDDVFFVLAGYPVADVRQFIEDNRFGEFCCIPGEVAYQDLPFWHYGADIALDPKISDSGEGSGKMMHYMAAGLPIVCFDLPYNRQILGDAGYYANPENPHSFVSAIEHSLNQLAQRKQKGQNSKTASRTNFSLKRVGKQLALIYHRLSDNFIPHGYLKRLIPATLGITEMDIDLLMLVHAVFI